VVLAFGFVSKCHRGQEPMSETPPRPDRDKERDQDDTPETPTDEPAPEPIEDPPAEPGPQGPYVV
jgi:hypothetical protein